MIVGGLFAMALLAGAGCRPFHAATQYCTEAPCADGLRCVEGVCLPDLPQPEPPPPCETVEDCSIDGSADGRDCVEGECLWADCVLDVQCGTRICDQGACTQRELCIGDEDCKDGGVCIDGTCRSPCTSDAECGQGLLPEVCLDGRCEQTCVIDLLCFGGICEDGLCEEAACGNDADCPGENQACTNGRCEGYTPCDEDDDCFDADYLCNQLGRCEARPSCITDDDCGPSFLCLGDICRPADTCQIADDCPTAGNECIAGRCVQAPVCRSNADCSAGSVCAMGSCFDPPSVDPHHVFVETPHGICLADGSGACSLSLFLGEVATVRVATFDEDGALVTGEVDVSADAPVTATDEGGGLVSLVASAAGVTQLTIDDDSGNELHSALSLRVIDTSGGDAVRVLVVDGGTGAPIANAAVTIGEAATASDATGLASFATAPGPDAADVLGLTVTVAGRRGLVVVGLSIAGNLRAVLPAVDSGSDDVAGVSTRVISTGDEIGPVGYGITLVGQKTIYDATLTTLFGPTFNSQLQAPIIGGIPVTLPAAVQLEAILPFSADNQVLRDRTYGVTVAGRRALVAFELRSEVNNLIGGALGATTVDVALNLADDAEGMDALLQEVGDVPALPRVADSDDIDGDGDPGELIPDWGALPTVELMPSRKPAERVGLIASGPPANARARLFVVGGLKVAGLGFVPTGMATISGASGSSEQLRVVQPAAAMSTAERALRVEAVYDDALRSSALYWSGATFAESIDLGAFLVPPEGSFVLDDVPMAGSRTLVLAASPGATTYAARVVSLAGEHLVLVPSIGAGGRSIELPATLSGAVAVLQTMALRRPGPSAELATSSFLVAGSGPRSDVREGADAVAVFVEAPGSP